MQCHKVLTVLPVPMCTLVWSTAFVCRKVTCVERVVFEIYQQCGARIRYNKRGNSLGGLRHLSIWFLSAISFGISIKSGYLISHYCHILAVVAWRWVGTIVPTHRQTFWRFLSISHLWCHLVAIKTGQSTWIEVTNNSVFYLQMRISKHLVNFQTFWTLLEEKMMMKSGL